MTLTIILICNIILSLVILQTIQRNQKILVDRDVEISNYTMESSLAILSSRDLMAEFSLSDVNNESNTISQEFNQSIKELELNFQKLGNLDLSEEIKGIYENITSELPFYYESTTNYQRYTKMNFNYSNLIHDDMILVDLSGVQIKLILNLLIQNNSILSNNSLIFIVYNMTLSQLEIMDLTSEYLSLNDDFSVIQIENAITNYQKNHRDLEINGGFHEQISQLKPHEDLFFIEIQKLIFYRTSMLLVNQNQTIEMMNLDTKSQHIIDNLQNMESIARQQMDNTILNANSLFLMILSISITFGIIIIGLTIMNQQITKTSLNELIKDLTRISEELVFQIKNGQKIAHDLSSCAQELSSSSEEISAGSENIANSQQQISKGAANQVEVINRTSNRLRELSNGILKIKDAINRIFEISDFISSIANQTNILALNAAIEAARAGESGRGFNVVSEQVRKLAFESKQAVTKTNQLLTNIQQVTQVQEEFANLILNEVDSIASVAEQTSSNTEQTAAAAEEQASSMEQITSTAQQLLAIADELYNRLLKIDIVDNDTFKNLNSNKKLLNHERKLASNEINEISSSTGSN